MPLVRVRPQRVEHTDGWSVGTAGRWHMKYEDGTRVARINVEFTSTGTDAYPSTLHWVGPDDTEVPLTEEERALVWPRFVEGMEALGPMRFHDD